MKQKQIIKKQPLVKKLLNSYADGLTLPYKHPEVKPALLTHLNLGFFALTDGSIEL
jgi:hypothetical protein